MDPEELEELDESQQRLLQIKSKIRFFDNCTDDELMDVVEEVKILKLLSNEIVFLETEKTETIYFIISGRVDIFKNFDRKANPQKIATVYSNEFFGEMAYINNQPRVATAKVSKETPAVLISFNISEIDDPDLEYIYLKIYKNFAQSLSKKLDKTNYKYSLT